MTLPSVLWRCWLAVRKGIQPEKTERWSAGVAICLERGADLHMAQLMPLPLTVSCFSRIQTGFTFLVPAHPRSPGQRAVKRVCVCVTESDNNNRHSTTTVAHWDQARPAQTQLDSWRWEHVLQLNFSQDSTSNSSATWWVRVKMRRVCSTQLKHHTSTTHISCRLTNTTGCLRFQSTCIFQKQY